MPLWSIYHPDSIFTTQSSKDEFAASITAAYPRLPAFYVVITFIPLPATSIYRSGKPISSLDKPFVRLVVHHLAYHAANNPEGMEAGYASGRRVVDTAIKEHIVDKGYYYEYAVSEEDRNLWMIDGFRPPEFGGAAFKVWKDGNKAVAYEEEGVSGSGGESSGV